MALNLRNKFGYFFRTPLTRSTREQTRHVSTADIGAVEYMADCITATTLGAVAYSANFIRWVRFVAPDRPTTLTRLALEQTVSTVGNFKLLLANNVDNHSGWSSYIEGAAPNDLLAESGDIDLTGTGLKSYTPGSPVSLTPGQVYWIGVWSDASVTLRAMQVYNSAGQGYGFNTNVLTHFLTSLAYGTALTAKAPVISGSSAGNAPCLRYSLAS